MEKNITEEKLKSINIEKISKEIDKYFSEKTVSPKEKLTKPTITSISNETLTEETPKKMKKEKKEEKPKKESKKDTKKKIKRMELSNETLSISTET